MEMRCQPPPIPADWKRTLRSVPRWGWTVILVGPSILALVAGVVLVTFRGSNAVEAEALMWLRHECSEYGGTNPIVNAPQHLDGPYWLVTGQCYRPNEYGGTSRTPWLCVVENNGGKCQIAAQTHLVRGWFLCLKAPPGKKPYEVTDLTAYGGTK